LLVRVSETPRNNVVTKIKQCKPESVFKQFAKHRRRRCHEVLAFENVHSNRGEEDYAKLQGRKNAKVEQAGLRNMRVL
jgi:hypothetical protein